LYVAVMGLLVEEQVLKFLELLVQALNRFEVTIDDMVNQPVQEKPDAVAGKVWQPVPAIEHLIDVEMVVLVDGHQHSGVMKAATSLGLC
jgi:hypothetical protein